MYPANISYLARYKCGLDKSQYVSGSLTIASENK